MEYNEILKDIKSNLTGDSNHDKAYLQDQMGKYLDHEYAQEILRELFRMFWDALTEDEKAAYIKNAKNDMPIVNLMDEMKELIKNGYIQIALEHMDKFMDSYPFQFNDDKVNEYHIFNNPIENILFLETYTGDKTIRTLPSYENYAMVFELYGKLLKDDKRYEESAEAFLRALKYNPVDDELLVNLMMYYDGIRDNVKVEEYAREILKYSYNPEKIAMAYAFLGYWYYNYGDYETSTAVYLISLLFKDNVGSWMELALMDDLIPIRDVDVVSRLIEKSIPVGANEKLFEILPFLIKETEKMGDVEFKSYCENILEELVKPEEIEEKIQELKNNLDGRINVLKKSMGLNG